MQIAEGGFRALREYAFGAPSPPPKKKNIKKKDVKMIIRQKSKKINKKGKVTQRKENSSKQRKPSPEQRNPQYPRHAREYIGQHPLEKLGRAAQNTTHLYCRPCEIAYLIYMYSFIYQYISKYNTFILSAL